MERLTREEYEEQKDLHTYYVNLTQEEYRILVELRHYLRHDVYVWEPATYLLKLSDTEFENLKRIFQTAKGISNETKST